MNAVPQLVSPTTRVHASFLVALDEYGAEGRYPDMHDLRLEEPAAFTAYVESLRRTGLPPGRPTPPGWVPMTLLWWVDKDRYLGRISIRHELTPALREYGGHIGYDIRPSARRRGHATRMLAAALPVAHRLGIDPALLTCHATNAASVRVIESNDGSLTERKGERLYFRVPTSMPR